MTMQTHPALDQALELHSMGLAPIYQRGKQAFQPGWNKERKSPDRLQSDFKPGLNLAIVTGELSRSDKGCLIVIDCDIRSGDQQHKVGAWQALLALFGKIRPTTLTGGGGAHWWFWFPPDRLPKHNKLILAQGPAIQYGGKEKSAWTIEALLSGHACTVPPSIHPSGKRYEWANGGPHVEDAPASLIEAIEKTQPANDPPAAVSEYSEMGGDSTVRLICGNDLTPEPIRWLWHGWLARGKLHVIAGAPGTGKTTLALALAASTTMGGRWPDSTRAEAGNILIWSGEDDISDTLLPRLLAMGADRNRIYFIGDVLADDKTRPFDPARDMQALSQEATRIGDVRLLIVDPVVNAVTGDSHKNTEVRRSLQPLVDLAGRLDAAVLGVSHFSKNTAGRDPVERVTGSVAFGALPRVVFGTAKANDDDSQTRRLFVRAKSNIGPDGGGFNYALEQAEVPGFPGLLASRVAWGQPLDGTALELLAVAESTEDSEERGALIEVADWLRDLLTEETGTMDKREIIRLARDNGFSERTIYRARDKLDVHVRTTGFGKDKRSVWSILPMLPTKKAGNNGKIDGTDGTHEPAEAADREAF